MNERKYLLEKVGKVAIVQLYADGFEDLNLNEKILTYYLSKASIAGRDITYDQVHRHGLAIRNLLEEIVTHSRGIDEKLLEKITFYLKLFGVFNGTMAPIIGNLSLSSASKIFFLLPRSHYLRELTWESKM
jgi:dipeptidyl-peptidase-3